MVSSLRKSERKRICSYTIANYLRGYTPRKTGNSKFRSVDSQDLHIFAAFAIMPLIMQCVERGDDVNVADKYLMRPLNYAAANGHIDAVLFFFEYGTTDSTSRSLSMITEEVHCSSRSIADAQTLFLLCSKVTGISIDAQDVCCSSQSGPCANNKATGGRSTIGGPTA